ncbi:helix-turn-helix domain-containing protein [Mycolicibacterium sp. XJ662]
MAGFVRQRGAGGRESGAVVNAAAHCARIALDAYDKLGKPMPPELLAWVDEQLGGGGSDPGTETLLSAAEVATLLGISPRAVRKAAAKLGGRKAGSQWVFERKAVDSYGRTRRGQ